jgi:hypothetical protein
MLTHQPFESHVARGAKQVWPDLALLEWCQMVAVKAKRRVS